MAKAEINNTPRRAALCGFTTLLMGSSAAAVAGTGPEAVHPDAELIGWRAALIAMEAAQRLDADARHHASYRATLAAVESTPANTIEGYRSKLAAAVAFYDPDPPEPATIFSGVLWDAVVALALPLGGQGVVAGDPDADLIQFCAKKSS